MYRPAQQGHRTVGVTAALGQSAQPHKRIAELAVPARPSQSLSGGLQTFGQGQSLCEEVHCLPIGTGAQGLLTREL